MTRIIQRDKSIIPACDIKIPFLRVVARETCDIDEVGGYKLGIYSLDVGIRAATHAVKGETGKPVIYDHQKAGTDIHESTPQGFMDAMVKSGVDAVILFPQAGPVTQYEWTRAAQERELGVIIGGEMTHPRYLEGDYSQGKDINYTEIFEKLGLIDRGFDGYIRKNAPEAIYALAAKMNVTNFVVPGNKPNKIRQYKDLIENCGVKNPSFYSPGLISQGGDISEAANVAGKSWHAIVGRGITQAENIREAALNLARVLREAT